MKKDPSFVQELSTQACTAPQEGYIFEQLLNSQVYFASQTLLTVHSF